MTFIYKVLLYIYSFILALLPSHTYIEGVEGQPETFFPTHATLETDKTMSEFLFRGLFRYDIYGTLVPDLAETWAISEDGLVYTIKIRDNQTWTDGTRISADDLIYSSFKDPDLAYVATDKVDDLTVRFTLPNKYAAFLSLLTQGIIQENSLEKQDPLFPVSSGDYRLASISRNGGIVSSVTLVTTNPEYDLKKLVFRYYSNENELVTAAKLGEIHGFTSEKKVELENFYEYKFPMQGIYYALYLNTESETLKDVALRQKLEKVLPIEDIINQRGINVEGPISRSLFTNKSITFDKYDDEFKDNLPDIKINLVYPDVYAHKEVAKKVKEFWEDRLGIDVELVAVNPEDIVSQNIQTRNYDVLLYGQEVGRDPDRYVLWHSTQKEAPGLNLSKFEQVRADRALEEGRKELINEKRVIHYNEFQRVMSEDVPVIFLYHPFRHYYISKYVSGVGEKYTFTYSDRFLDLYNWKRVVTN